MTLLFTTHQLEVAFKLVANKSSKRRSVKVYWKFTISNIVLTIDSENYASQNHND